MRPLEVFPRRWLEYEPPSNCHDFGIGETIAAIAASAAAAAPTLETIGTVAAVAGTGLSVKAGLDNAEYQSAVGRATAAAEQQKANEDAAAGQRTAIAADRQTRLLQSRAQSLAADSGTDATSPDILTTEGRIAEQGRYNALSALYEGQSRARSENFQADIDLFKAKRISAGAPLAAVGTALAGVGTFVDRRLRRGAYLNQYAPPA